MNEHEKGRGKGRKKTHTRRVAFACPPNASYNLTITFFPLLKESAVKSSSSPRLMVSAITFRAPSTVKEVLMIEEARSLDEEEDSLR